MSHTGQTVRVVDYSEDAVGGDALFITRRIEPDGLVGLCISKRNNGDIEIVVDQKSAIAIRRAIDFVLATTESREED